MISLSSLWLLCCIFDYTALSNTLNVDLEYPPPYPEDVTSFIMDKPVFSDDVLLDTWEPQIVVTDDGEIYVFAVSVHGVRSCEDCGEDPIIYRKSSDFGNTWDTIGDSELSWGYINTNPLTWFADIVGVHDPSGNIYITYIGYTKQPPPHPWNILFQKSLNGGESWSNPVVVSGNISADKNWMSIHPSNPDVLYVTFNSQFPYVTRTSDGGSTWSTPLQVDYQEGSYFYAGGSGVRSSGEVFFAYMATPDYGEDTVEEEFDDDAYSYYGPVGNETDAANSSYAYVYSSNNEGATWKRYNISRWKDTQKCPEYAECGTDFLVGSCSLAIDMNDTVYYAFGADDTTTPANETRVLLTSLRSGSDEFSIPVDISDAPYFQNVFHGFVMIAATGNGDVRAAWMDNRTGMWNVYYRESKDSGVTWSSPSVRLSFYNKYGFQNSQGFEFPYGDYGSLKIDSDGNSHVVWGEGLGWNTGGTIMYSTQATYNGYDSNDDSDADTYSATMLSVSVVVAALCSAVIGAVSSLYFVGYFTPKDALLFGLEKKSPSNEASGPI